MLAGHFIVSLASLSIDGLVDQTLEGETLVQTKIMMELRTKSLPEPSLFLGISGHFFRGIACKISKLPIVSIYSHLALGEVTELLPLTVHQTFWDMVQAKASLKSLQVVT
jgi:hypothetical protein